MTDQDKTTEVEVSSEQTSLTQWQNPPKLEDLKQHLEDARPIHASQKTKVEEWLDNLHVRNGGKPKIPKGGSQVQPKLILKQAEWRYPALSEPFLSTDDIYNVNPVTWEDKQAAEQNQLVLNYQFNNKIDKVKFIDDYVRTGVDEGTIILKTGWVFEEEEYETVEPVFTLVQDINYAQVIQEVDALKNTSPSQYDTDTPDEIKAAYEASIQYGVPYRPEITGEKTVKKTRTIKNHPTVEVRDFRNVIIDPTAYGDMKKASFVIDSYETSLSDLRKDGRYKNLDKLQVNNNSPLNEPDHSSDIATTNFNFQDQPRTKFVVYEYWGFWDIDGSGVVKPIVAAWVGNQMIRMEENPFPDKQLPFVLVPYRPIRRSNYGEPDGELLLDNQKIVGAVTRGMIDLMAKSANSQTGIRKDMLDITQRRRYDNGEDYEFNPGVNPAEGVFMHKFPEIPQSAPLMIQMMNQEAESLTGVKSFSGGVTGNSLGDVAAGVRGALDASSKRETAILRRLAQGIIEVGRKFISMNSEFLSDEEVIRITNDEFVKVRRDDLAGEFDLKLSISTAEEDDHKAQQLAFLLQTVGPDEDPEMRRMILADICKLNKMPELAQKIKAYQPQPDPMQQKMQELAIAKAEAEIEEIRARAQGHISGAILHEEKVNSEKVKQGHIKSDTDLKDLNFVEQESGVTQERELQKQREKAALDAEIKRLEKEFEQKYGSKEK
jgi:hypothetical protein